MATMTETLVEIDGEALELVAALINTKTKKDTLNGAPEILDRPQCAGSHAPP